MAIQAVSTMILTNDAEYQDSRTSSTASTEQGSVVDRILSAKLTADGIKSAFQKTHLQYDRQGDEHYNLISALHKSVRGGYVGYLSEHMDYEIGHSQWNSQVISYYPLAMRMQPCIGLDECS